MEDGVSERKLDWQTRKGSRIRIEIIRMTSFEERALFTIDYRITSVDFCGKLEIKSLHKGLVQNYFNPDDPRLAGESHQHLHKAVLPIVFIKMKCRWRKNLLHTIKTNTVHV